MSSRRIFLGFVVIVFLAACSSSDSTADVSIPADTTPLSVPNTASTPDPARSSDHSSSGEEFVETFDGNTGLERFAFNVWHRETEVGGSVQADHDLTCGDPSTQRTVSAETSDSSFYLCVDHLMTSVGDWSGYSLGWFMPDRTFTSATRVAWDVNVTNLDARQWWEVMIVPASFDSGFEGCRYCAVQSWLSPDPAHLPVYPDSAIVVGNGAFGNTVSVHAGGQERYEGWQKTCGDSYSLFEESGACESKKMRLPFSIADDGAGTITVDYGNAHTETFPGSFPDEFVVIFKDHNYTPDKDGTPVGHTWHWDNVTIV